MNQASFFIKTKALFGGYPSHKQVIELMNQGVVWFIDLTNNYEKNIKVYSHLVNNWINYPIQDGYIPSNKKKFVIFLLVIGMIVENLKPGEKIYLHCRGGHGRSTLVVACFLCMVLNTSPAHSLNLAREYHSFRPNLKPKWLVKWPLNFKQRQFVENFFGSFYFHSNYKEEKIKRVATKIDFFRYLVILNFYLHQHNFILEELLNSGFQTVKGEGILSSILQDLRYYVLYDNAINLLY